MNQQTTETVNYPLGEANDEQDFFEFADLNLTDEELDGIKGGGTWPPPGGTLNHNQTVVSDETDLDELEDLLLTDAQESEIKGGGTWPPPGGTFNHNETVAKDDVAGTDLLADLTVADAEQIKGGNPQGTGKTLTCALLGR